VLDAGCGTGENALHVASLGLPVLGVDVAETALAMARAKAGDRGIEAEFAAADAFRLERLERTFETVLDCGVQPRRGWNAAAVEPDGVRTRYHDDDGAPAWLATIRRI
jgi:SAM-dependent methyltransferase